MHGMARPMDEGSYTGILASATTPPQAATVLRERYERVAIIDVDVHPGTLP